MGLGPSLSIRQTQQLVLTPQLQQAIKLLQLSNLELESYIAEELAKNPLLEARSDEEPPEQASGDGARSRGRLRPIPRSCCSMSHSPESTRSRSPTSASWCAN